MGVSKGQERKRHHFSKLKAKDLLNLMKNINLYVHETQQTSIKRIRKNSEICQHNVISISSRVHILLKLIQNIHQERPHLGP